jgi:catechol 2,3-dioxygenase-like lactoylglutathione lyase family enzyme
METALRFDHVALPCFDVAASRRFYEEALGLELLSAFEGESPLWGGRFLLMMFGGGAGGAGVDLFALEGLAQPAEALPAGIRHVAIAAASAAELAAVEERLVRQGVWISERVDHGDHDSIYCFDPSGNQLEVTFRRRATAPSADPGAVLARWCEAHPAGLRGAGT